MAHLCVRWFGDGEISVRIPAILGFWVFCLCLFRFTSRRVGIYYALAALLLPTVLETYYYSLEACPYGPELAFCGLALVAWQLVAQAQEAARAGVRVAAPEARPAVPPALAVWRLAARVREGPAAPVEQPEVQLVPVAPRGGLCAMVRASTCKPTTAIVANADCRVRPTRPPRPNARRVAVLPFWPRGRGKTHSLVSL